MRPAGKLVAVGGPQVRPMREIRSMNQGVPSVFRSAVASLATAAAFLLAVCTGSAQVITGEGGQVQQRQPAGKAGTSEPSTTRAEADAPEAAPATRSHRDEVMRSSFCASCHPAIYAEHVENTHGR